MRKPQSLLGGETLTFEWIHHARCASFLQQYYAHWPPVLKAALDVGTSYPMHSVILRNLPAQTTPAKLETKLQRSYALGLPIPTHINWRRMQLTKHGRRNATPSVPAVQALPLGHADSTSTSFLVSLRSASEAARLVRSWHRTRFAPQKYTVAATGDRFVVDAELLY